MVSARSCCAALVALILAGCAAGPELAAGKSGVYGVVTARPHAEVLAKWIQLSGGDYDAQSLGPRTPAEAIDYGSLREIYVALIDSRYRGSAVHDVTFLEDSTKPESLAVAVGDSLRIRNATARPLTFFLAATDGEAFQDIAAIPPGGVRQARVGIEGLLDLSIDEDARLAAHLLARRGLTAQVLSSGARYAFRDLEPGRYRLIFWNWRLGSIEHTVDLAADRLVHINEVLSVDRTVR